LDQLLKQTQAAGAPGSGDPRVAPSAPEASVTLDPNRGRELPRTRERGDTR
jgi:hypothetical protein